MQRGLLTHPPSLPPQGSGRYSIYIANYAYGNVGPDALIEMDPEASDLSQGILALRDVAAEAGVSKYTGRQSDAGWRAGVLWVGRAGGLGLGPGPWALQGCICFIRDHRRGWACVPGEGRMKALFHPITQRPLLQHLSLQGLVGYLAGVGFGGPHGGCGT